MDCAGSPQHPTIFVPVEVLSTLLRGRMLGMLFDAHATGRLQFFGEFHHLAHTAAFRVYLRPLWTTDWFVYAKCPFETRAGAGLSLPLHPPRRHLQRPIDLRRRERSYLQIQGLPH
jgi:hypothetical protein